MVTSISRGRLYSVPLVSANGEPSVVAETDGGPNGLALHGDGSFWVTQNGGHVIAGADEPDLTPGIQRVASGDAEFVVERDLQAPNDLAFGPDGLLWFTDPHPKFSREQPLAGRVWTLEVGSDQPRLVIDDAIHPNGLAFDAPGQNLLLAETALNRITRYPLSGSGSVGSPEPFAQLESEMLPDGMAIDAEGHVFAATAWGQSVAVCDPDGGVREVIELPDCFPTNVCFAGPDRTTLVITAAKGGRVLAIERDVPGIALRDGGSG